MQHSGSKVFEIPSLLSIYHAPIRNPHLDFSYGPILFSFEDGKKFNKDFALRNFYPIVSLDLAELKADCNLGLSPWFRDYESFLSIHASFSPTLVRVFYFNMIVHALLDKNNNVAEEKILTYVRGKRIAITVNYINDLLQIANPPLILEIHYDNEKIFKILRLDEQLSEPVGSLHSPLIAMPPIHRAL